VETIGSKRSYALTGCMPNNDDDDDDEMTFLLLNQVSKLMSVRSLQVKSWCIKEP